MIKIGILGAANIAKKISETVNLMRGDGDDRIVIEAVASRSLDRAKAFAEEFGI